MANQVFDEHYPVKAVVVITRDIKFPCPMTFVS